jgi:enoyl-CoA hydratase
MNDSVTPLTARTDGKVRVLSLDDGKANVFTPAVLASIHRELDAIETDRDIAAVLLCGRERQFSGGFDLKEFAKGPAATRDLVIAGGELCNRLLVFPKVTVTAITGNAIAAGAIVSMACDWNVGTAGSFKMGLPETAIGMSLPIYAIELARARLLPPYFTRATVLGELFDPPTALAAGYLDEVAEAGSTLDAALARAHALAELHPGPLAYTKGKAREVLHELIGRTLVADVTSLTTGLAARRATDG